MNHLLAHFIMFLPVPIEVAFDKLMWYLGKDDKPISTWVLRPALWALAGLGVLTLTDRVWWQIAPVIVAYFGLSFNYIINGILGRPFFYLGEDWFDRQLSRLHNIPRLWAQIWITALALCLYFYDELYNAGKYILNQIL